MKPARPPSTASSDDTAAKPGVDSYSFGEALQAAEGRPPQSPWRRLLAQYGTRNIVIGTGIIVLVLAAFALPTGREGDPFDGPGAALDITLKLGAVLALAYVALAALKRYAGSKVSQRGALLEVLDSTTLAPNRSVYVIRAGSKRLVLGVTQTQITALAELPDTEPDALDILADDDAALPLP